MNTRPSTTLQIYWQIRDKLNLEPWLNLANESKLFSDRDAAGRATIGLLQWITYHIAKEDADPTVMMGGPINTMFELLLKERTLYQAFCQEHFGYKVHRFPVCHDRSADIEESDGIDFMLAALANAYGDDLCEALIDWNIERDHHQLVAVSVALVGEAVMADNEVPDFRECWTNSGARMSHV